MRSIGYKIYPPFVIISLNDKSSFSKSEEQLFKKQQIFSLGLHKKRFRNKRPMYTALSGDNKYYMYLLVCLQFIRF